MSHELFLLVGIFLFVAGLYLVITRKNNILILIGIELMFNAANINFAVFGKIYAQADGTIMVFFNLLIAVCETAVALAIFFESYRLLKTIKVGDLRTMKE